MKKRYAESVATGSYSFKHKAKALFYFFGPIAILSLGIAMIDWFQGQPGGQGGYYAGWFIFMLGIGLFLLGMDHALFKPAWLFLVMLITEIYLGWWNLFWTAFSLSYFPDGRYFVNGVALAYVGPFWPWNTGGGVGVVFVTAWEFYLMIVVGIILPIIVALLAPRDASFKTSCERD